MGLEITEVRIKLADTEGSVDPDSVHLLAYAAVTFGNEFVVHDMKLVQGRKGILLGMPNRRVTDRCWKCQYKNPVTNRYCGYCGSKQKEIRYSLNQVSGKPDIYADQAHPITPAFREQLITRICDAYDLASLTKGSNNGTGNAPAK